VQKYIKFPDFQVLATDSRGDHTNQKNQKKSPFRQFLTIFAPKMFKIKGHERFIGGKVMSWDVVIMRFPEGFDGDFEEIPDDWEPENLFTQNYFEEEIKKVFPNIIGDKTWMTLNAETFSIEFNIGGDDPVNSITLHIRGGDEAIQVIGTICKKFNCQALDTTECKLIDFDKETNEGFTQWRAYKDKVMDEQIIIKSHGKNIL
jgi:hypothetical protein